MLIWKIINMQSQGELMGNIKIEKILLNIGLFSIAIYLINLIVLASLYSEYSHFTNVVSDLGRLEAPHHKIFNTVIISVGFLYLLTAVGFYLSIHRLTGRKLLAVLIAIFIGSFGINLFFGGLYPLPDPRHAGYGIGTFYFLTPLLLIWVFSKTPGTSNFKRLQIISFIAVLFSIIVMGGMIAGIINIGNFSGIMQRIQVLIIMSWYAYTCIWLLNKPLKNIS